MLYKCRIIDTSGPAAGNRYIFRSVITRAQDVTPDLILVQWNFGKFDIYIQHQPCADEITQGTGIRNFLLDIHTGKTTTGPGYWCSSIDNTVPWKKYYNKYIKSKVGTALDDLEAMISLQNYCAKRNILYQFFTHDNVDHDFLSTDQHTRIFYNEIDWSNQVFDSVITMYTSHPAYQFNISGLSRDYHWVPNADWQYWFANTQVSNLLASVGIHKKTPYENSIIKNYCHDKTLSIYQQVTRLES